MRPASHAAPLSHMDLRMRASAHREAAISYPVLLLPFFDVVFMRPRRRSN